MLPKAFTKRFSLPFISRFYYFCFPCCIYVEGGKWPEIFCWSEAQIPEVKLSIKK
jgi:hypothetical protein